MGLRETARQVPIDPGHLSKIERGERQPSVDMLKRLADIYGLPELSKLLAPYVRRGSAS
jgi:transcriptional regulator with XRE-family HTH domain